MNDTLIKCNNITKDFTVGTQSVRVLTNINVSIDKGDFIVIFGPSGCGKSTLLHVLLGLEIPTTGEVIYQNKDIYKNMNEDDRAQLRKESIGMVYQQPNWIKSLSVVENLALPLVLNGEQIEVANNIAYQKLKDISMSNWANYNPTELSSGQLQKVALARALITDPDLIIADEPTGNLDFDSGMELMNQLAELNLTEKKTILMVTHDLEYLKYAKRTLQMLNGTVVKITDNLKSKRGQTTLSGKLNEKF